MAQTIDIHPVRFDHQLDCSIQEGNYTQVVQVGDITQFQMLLDICPPDLNLIQNPAFTSLNHWLLFGTVSIDTAAGLGIKGAGGGISAISQFIPVADGHIVMITFQLQIITGTMELTCGNLYSESFDRSGTYVRFFTSDTLNGISFGGDGNANWAINQLAMFAINTNFSVQVIDEDDIVIRTMTPISAPSYFDFTRQYFTFSYDWTDDLGAALPDGCYRIQVSDPCECGNGGFISQDFYTGLNQWQLPGSTNNWDIIFGTANFLGTEINTTAHIEDAICEDEDYLVTYTLANMAGNEFFVRLGANAGITQTTNGTFSETITAIGNDPRVILNGANTGGASAFEVTDFSVVRVPRSYSFVSNRFDLRASVRCSCTVLVCCDHDNLQSGYGDTLFAPRVRLIARYGQGDHQADQVSYFSGSGVRTTPYWKGSSYKLFTYSSAGYIHDFMAHLKGYDHVYIDDVEVAVLDEDIPSIAWAFDYDFGERIFQITPKVQRIKKRRLNSYLTSCTKGGVPIAGDGAGGSFPSGKPLGAGGQTTKGTELVSTG